MEKLHCINRPQKLQRSDCSSTILYEPKLMQLLQQLGLEVIYVVGSLTAGFIGGSCVLSVSRSVVGIAKWPLRLPMKNSGAYHHDCHSQIISYHSKVKSFQNQIPVAGVFHLLLHVHHLCDAMWP